MQPVGYRAAVARCERFGELAPALLDLVDGGHVCHRTTGGEVRQHDGLLCARENVCGLCHEVHAAEDEGLGLRVLLRGLREHERVANEVGILHDLVALVEVAKNLHAVTESFFGREDPPIELLVARPGVALRQGALSWS